jgi:hypothetical protein
VKRLILVLPVLALGACFREEATTVGSQRIYEQWEESPTASGGKVGSKTITATSETREERKTGPDTDAIVAAVSAAVRGAVGGGGTPWGLVSGGLAALTTAAAGYAISKRGEAKAARTDGDEGWNRLMDIQEQERAEAKRLRQEQRA